MNRYSAKLLFQFKVTVAGREPKRRLCEERFLMFRAVSARRALAHAKRRGRESQHSYEGQGGANVRFEFVGVMELLLLGSECERDEVWYEIKRMVSPSERKDELLLPEGSLHAVRMEAELKPTKKRKRPYSAQPRG